MHTVREGVVTRDLASGRVASRRVGAQALWFGGARGVEFNSDAGRETLHKTSVLHFLQPFCANPGDLAWLDVSIDFVFYVAHLLDCKKKCRDARIGTASSW
jgi:hypothetical protein